MKNRVIAWVILSVASLFATESVSARVRMPSLFTDHMVLQRGIEIAVWGWAAAGEAVSVTLSDRSASTMADARGRWRVKLAAMPAGGPHELVVKGENTIKINDVLIGEVWLCSGQSNMEMKVSSAARADLEILTARYPKLRLLTVPRHGTQVPQEDFEGRWSVCSPTTVGDFSATGYFFGRDVHLATGVPVGLIHAAWGGSVAEAWTRRDLLEGEAMYKNLLAKWQAIEASPETAKFDAEYQAALKAWKSQQTESGSNRKSSSKPNPEKNPLTGRRRPANLYNGMIHPLLGYSMRGAIWYQGESNAKRAHQYRQLFPLMINNWREAWGIGDFSFYWVQLPNFKGVPKEPTDSDWAELREAQTHTLRLPNTAQAITIGLGESRNIHPRNKQDVGRRLARIALARDYGKKVAWRSPDFKSLEIDGSKAIVTLNRYNGIIRPRGASTIRGFTIAGADRKFVFAEANVLKNGQFEVSSKDVPEPVAVRYAWAANPVFNLYDLSGLPVAPFRTDNWPGVTDNVTH